MALVKFQQQEVLAARIAVLAELALCALHVLLDSFVLAVTMMLLSVILAYLDFISQRKTKKAAFPAFQENFKMWRKKARVRTVYQTSTPIGRSRFRAKIVLTEKHHPTAALHVFFVQLGRPAQRRVLVAQQVSFEQEEAEMARLAPCAQQECTRSR